MNQEKITERWLKEDLNNNQELLDWYSSRPEAVKKVIDKYPPSWLYDLRGQRVFITIYNEMRGDKENQPHINVDVYRSTDYNPGHVLPVNITGVELNSLKPICHQSEADVHQEAWWPYTWS